MVEEYIIVRVKIDLDYDTQFAKSYHYLERFPDYFGEPPVLSDPRKIMEERQLAYGETVKTFSTKIGRGIRVFLIKSSPGGHLMYLVFKDIFGENIEILSPANFKIDKDIEMRYREERNSKLSVSGKKMYLTERTLRKILGDETNET